LNATYCTHTFDDATEEEDRPEEEGRAAEEDDREEGPEEGRGEEGGSVATQGMCFAVVPRATAIGRTHWAH
jgi:hypothetical protein